MARVLHLVILILLSVIVLLVVLLNHYYLNYKRLISIEFERTVFDDLIPPAAKKNDHALTYLNNYWSTIDNDLRSFSLALHPFLPFTDERYYSKKLPTTGSSEAYNCLHAAMVFKQAGKLKKAKKVLEHAVAIEPNNPDVLNFYGEFLEQTHKDVVTADELYSRALVYSPRHEGALENRKRTGPVVDRIDMEMFKSIDRKRDLFKDKLDFVDTDLKREAYYSHIYHTVSIEGNTLTLRELQYILETGKAVAGKSVMEHNEVLGLENAMQYVKLLTRLDIIGVKEILGIHRRVMGHVAPLLSGVFRTEQVFVGSHVPPAPEKLPILMQEYVEWLNSEEALSMHAVRYAALAHLKLVDIHPFSDGNGRTSRLIMNLILIRANYPPVIILRQHRKQYYNYLDLAHKGDVRPFVRFIAHCTDEVLNMYLGGVDKNSLTGGTSRFNVIEMDGETVQLN